MSDEGKVILEEGMPARPGVIDDLIGNSNHFGRHPLSQTSNSSNCDNPLDAQVLQSPNVRAIVNPVRRNRMSIAMAGQKGDILAIVLTMGDRPIWLTEWR